MRGQDPLWHLRRPGPCQRRCSGVLATRPSELRDCRGDGQPASLHLSRAPLEQLRLDSPGCDLHLALSHVWQAGYPAPTDLPWGEPGLRGQGRNAWNPGGRTWQAPPEPRSGVVEDRRRPADQLTTLGYANRNLTDFGGALESAPKGIRRTGLSVDVCVIAVAVDWEADYGAPGDRHLAIPLALIACTPRPMVWAPMLPVRVLDEMAG